MEKAKFGDISTAAVTRNAASDNSVGFEGYYDVVCYDANGNIKWEDRAPNLVTAVGKNALFDYYFGSTGTGGGTSSGANYLGLVGSASATANYFPSDTMTSHAGWQEVGGSNAPAYTGNRQSPNWTAASNNGSAAGNNISSKAASALTFTFTSGGTVFGCFINSGASASATKDTGTTGVLYSGGSFTGGSKIVANGDSLAVTYTTTATS
jgi:hypothetical protein